MSAGRYDILADQGSTFGRSLVYLDSDGTPVDLSGYEAELTVRETYTSDQVLIAVSSEGTAPGIVLGGTAGSIVVSVGAVTMAAVPAGVYVYDLELTSDTGFVVKPVRGQFEIRPEVTR